MKYIITALILIIVIESIYLFKSQTPMTTQTTKIVRVNTPEYIVNTDTVYLIKPQRIDTVEIIKKYYQKIDYKRQFKVDDYQIELSDTLYYNSLHFGNLKVKKAERWHYYVAANYNNGVGVGVMVMKNRFGYSINYQPFEKVVGFGICFKIK